MAIQNQIAGWVWPRGPVNRDHDEDDTSSYGRVPSRLPERQGRACKRRQSFQIYEQLHHVAHTPKEQGNSLTNSISGHGLGGVSLPSASQKRLRGNSLVDQWSGLGAFTAGARFNPRSGK